MRIALLRRFDQWTETFGFRGSLAIVYFIVCGTLPLAAVILTYENGWLYAGFYARLFLYPLFFGWLAVLCAHTSYPYLRDHVLTPQITRGLLLFLAGIALGAVAIELGSENVAPWEIRPSVLNEQARVGTGPLLSERFSAVGLEAMGPEIRAELQSTMIQKLGSVSEAFERWSIVRPLYIISFLVQSFVLLYVFAATISLAGFAYMQRPTDAGYHRAVLWLSAALLVSGIWMLMTLGFQVNKVKVYPGEFNEMANYAIQVLYLIALALILVHYVSFYQKHFKETVTALFGSGLVTVLSTQGDRLASWFGPEQVYRNSMVLLLVVVLVLGILWLIIPAIRNGWV